jgi:hypothetical protein
VTTRGVFVALLIAVAALAVGCGPGERIDLGREPPTLLKTIPFGVGDRYTLGMTGPSESSIGQIRITAVEVIHAAGIEVVGIGVLDPVAAGQGIGLVLGWPPSGYELAAIDEAVHSRQWEMPIYTVVGVETTELVSGLRGVEVTWVDGQGASHSRVFDLTVLTCQPGSCDADEETQETLTVLGLMRP